MQRITDTTSWPLHGIAASRQLEALSQVALPPQTLMQRAGLSVARLAQALAPHAKHAWIACGPGNNGGDGFEAALQLQRKGWHISLNWLGSDHEPADAQLARQRALQAGLQIQSQAPERFELAIDALLGLGGDLSADRPSSAMMRQWLARMHASGQPVLAVDLPSGLNGDTGQGGVACSPHDQRHTLSLLSLKPGLMTAHGRDQSGQLWFDPLGADLSSVPASAWLIGADALPAIDKARAAHASHKGSYGDVMVVGGVHTPQEGVSMVGAALLAARAALHSGAGRVYVSLLGQAALHCDVQQPELMFRPWSAFTTLAPGLVTVCGCGAGSAAAAVLPQVLASSGPLVLDADALNALAAEAPLGRQLQRRQTRETVLTPHPLEAARLLACSAAEVQADRLRAAQSLSDKWRCTVVLKGSGSVVAAPGRTAQINPTGNALLATAGTGDVLAGMVGAALARGLGAWDAARWATHRHGALADRWAQRRPGQALCASDLVGPAL
ncbi:MAG: NAD(P)H-hydrate dehydratase [Betaproteobacteria bacterium]